MTYTKVTEVGDSVADQNHPGGTAIKHGFPVKPPGPVAHATRWLEDMLPPECFPNAEGRAPRGRFKITVEFTPDE